MGCPYGCQDKTEVDFMQNPADDIRVSFDVVIEAVEDVLDQVHEIGLRDGMKILSDLSVDNPTGICYYSNRKRPKGVKL